MNTPLIIQRLVIAIVHALLAVLGFPRIVCLCGSTSNSIIPIKRGETTLTVTWVEDDPTRGMVDPWPFHEDAVMLRCEGRRLAETFSNERAMRAVLDYAPWVTITMQLVRP